MTNGQNAARARHLESVANAAKRYTLREILDVTQAVAAELETLTVAFTGATSIAGGASGIVPEPAAGDESKFLCGNGFWVNEINGKGLSSNDFTDAFKAKLENLDENLFVPRTSLVSFTVATSAWQENPSEETEFIYYADIPVSGLTENDYAEVNFNRASQSVIVDANLCATGETMTDKIRIFAENVPTEAISGEYIITKGAV